MSQSSKSPDPQDSPIDDPEVAAHDDRDEQTTEDSASEADLADTLAAEFADRSHAADHADGGDGGDERAATDPLAVLRAECQGLKEQLLRERADFDNIRKRLRREAEESGARAVARFVRPILMQLDNFTLALEAAKPEAFMDFAMGVTMIRDGLLAALGDAGISPVETNGHFDPAHHEVVAEVPHELPKGHIVAVQRSGFRMGEQLVRSAQVVVSAGAAADEAPAASEVSDAPRDPANEPDAQP